MAASKEPARVIAWGRVALVFGPLLLLLTLLLGPWLATYWSARQAAAEADKIETIGKALQSSAGRLYLRYLEAKGKCP